MGDAAAPGGRRLLVTGASSGIGEAVARAALARGMRVAGIARRADRLREVDGLVAVPADLTDDDAAVTAVERSVAQLGGLDALVLAAGTNRPGTIGDGHPRDWRTILDTNVLAVLTVAKAALPALRAGTDPMLVTITSTSAQRVLSAANGVYAASKAAVHAVTDALRVELDGAVRVTEVAPGYVRDTEIHRDYAPRHKAEADERQERFGVDRYHVADLVLDLLVQPADLEVPVLTVTQPAYRPTPYGS